MTLPSSTIAKRLRTSLVPKANSRCVTLANWSVPLPLKTMFTAQVPVFAPCVVVMRPLLASAIVSPDTSTGPRMYLKLPSVSQVTKGSSAGATLAPSASSWAQLKLSYLS